MPWAAKRPCPGGCGGLVSEGYCAACKSAGKGVERRPTAAKRLYGSRWQRFSKVWLQRPENLFCVGYPKGVHGERLVGAQVPDHIKAHKGDAELFWDEGNLQPLCIPCNSRKAANEEGGGWRRV
jgi:5-methylcytosine-specific restriction enzyme A